MVFKIVIVGSNPASLVCFSFMLNSFFYLIIKMIRNFFLNFFKCKNLTFDQIGQKKFSYDYLTPSRNLSDLILLYLYSIYFNLVQYNNTKNTRVSSRINQLANSYFFNFKNSIKTVTNLNSFFSGLNFF